LPDIADIANVRLRRNTSGTVYPNQPGVQHIFGIPADSGRGGIRREQDEKLAYQFREVKYKFEIYI
jgi:hypothetical protein